MPEAFYPDYSRHGCEIGQIVYGFKCLFNIKCNQKLLKLNKPKDSDVAIIDEGKSAVISCREPNRALFVKFQSSDMHVPTLMYGEYPDF